MSDTSDIVLRLRRFSTLLASLLGSLAHIPELTETIMKSMRDPSPDILNEAADEIVALRARIKELETRHAAQTPYFHGPDAHQPDPVEEQTERTQRG